MAASQISDYKSAPEERSPVARVEILCARVDAFSLWYKLICEPDALEARMQTRILSDASSPGQQLRYLTVHFRDLQGLRMAPFWFLLLVLTSLAKTGSLSSGHLFWAALVLIAAQFGWLYLSGRWYERRYGVVKEPEPPVASGLISIMHPESQPQRAANPLARRYGYLSGINAVQFLLWTFTTVPDIFGGHNIRPGYLVMLVAVFQVFPRCIYSVTNNWSVVLRRLFASSVLIAIIGIYFEYRFARMDLWTWMALLLSFLLLLDLYDHWLLNHLIGSDFTEESHE
jgi:hypothetical protein